MNLSQLIKESLKDIGSPVTELKYLGNRDTYVVFYEYLQQPSDFSEDDEELVEHYYQINIYSRDLSVIGILEEKIKTRMKSSGFQRDGQFDAYDQETNLAVRTVRFNYLSEV